MEALHEGTVTTTGTLHAPKKFPRCCTALKLHCFELLTGFIMSTIELDMEYIDEKQDRIGLSAHGVRHPLGYYLRSMPYYNGKVLLCL